MVRMRFRWAPLMPNLVLASTVIDVGLWSSRYGRRRAAVPAGIFYSESLTAIQRVSASEEHVLPYAI